MTSNDSIKNHCIASLGEFAGTFLFLFFAFAGTQTANEAISTEQGPNLQQLLYISLVFGFSLAINVWVFFRVSGGLFNPAVTLALCVTGVVPIQRSIFIFIAQFIGGIAAAGLVRGLIPGNGVRFNCTLRPGTSIAQGLFLEMFLTAELVFAILMLAAEKTKATFVAPVGIGLALFIAELVGVYWTGGALNPIRAFGPQVVMGTFEGYHWIYWIGPILGALLASGFYKLLKFFNYEEVNGDQDKSPEDEHMEKVVKHVSRSTVRGQKAVDPRLGSSHSNCKAENVVQVQHGPSSVDQDAPYGQQTQQSGVFVSNPESPRFNSEATATEPLPVIGRDGQLYFQDANAQNRSERRNTDKTPSSDYRNDEEMQRPVYNQRENTARQER